MKKFLLAVILLFSFGVAQAECLYLSNPDECRAEAEKGNAIAQFVLGFMYENGEGVAQDFKLAEKWYLKAAEQGDADAQNRLGEVYRDGNLEVSRDYLISYMWFNIADKNGYQEALNKKDAVADNMTSLQIEEAQKLAMEWMAEHQ